MIQARFFIIILLLASFCIAQQPERYLVGVHYYLWYSQASWQRIDADPLLGPYDSAQSSVIDQHLRWANQYGISFFGVEWAGRDKEQNNVLRERFFASPELKNMKVCIAYDTLTRFAKYQSPPFDFSDPRLFREFVSDFDYLSKTYFSHPGYLKFNGRPVVWVYIARGWKGNWKRALAEARRAVKKNGYDLYLDGDLLWPDKIDLERLPYFDAASAYVLNQKELFLRQDVKKTSDVVPLAAKYFREWAGMLEVVKNHDTAEPVAFHPVINPQFWKPSDKDSLYYTLDSVDDFRRMAEAAETEASWNRQANAKVIWITSWNEWYEGTAIEPAHNGATLQRNYGFELLRALKEVFSTNPKS
ncbi:glycoside hydrolase family 99-like domain-containing protein [bacterium]|nr:glycoside hydrolase family 99-like domain-containing protein [bacterium]